MNEDFMALKYALQNLPFLSKNSEICEPKPKFRFSKLFSSVLFSEMRLKSREIIINSLIISYFTRHHLITHTNNISLLEQHNCCKQLWTAEVTKVFHHKRNSVK